MPTTAVLPHVRQMLVLSSSISYLPNICIAVYADTSISTTYAVRTGYRRVARILRLLVRSCNPIATAVLDLARKALLQLYEDAYAACALYSVHCLLPSTYSRLYEYIHKYAYLLPSAHSRYSCTRSAVPVRASGRPFLQYSIC